MVGDIAPEPRDEVTLTEFDPDGEIKVVASALYAVSRSARRSAASRSRDGCRATTAPALLRAYVGERANRRHKPGRAFERTRYRFDVLADYGAFRDLQRHRLLTLEWQPLSPEHGYVEPAAIEEAGALADWRAVMDRSAELHATLVARGCADAAPYAVVMAYRVRFYMDMNAREAMHVIELRTRRRATRRTGASARRCTARSPRSPATARIAAAMQFADHSEVELERLQSERALGEEADTSGLDCATSV